MCSNNNSLVAEGRHGTASVYQDDDLVRRKLRRSLLNRAPCGPSARGPLNGSRHSTAPHLCSAWLGRSAVTHSSRLSARAGVCLPSAACSQPGARGAEAPPCLREVREPPEVGQPRSTVDAREQRVHEGVRSRGRRDAARVEQRAACDRAHGFGWRGGCGQRVRPRLRESSEADHAGAAIGSIELNRTTWLLLVQEVRMGCGLVPQRPPSCSAALPPSSKAALPRAPAAFSACQAEQRGREQAT
jgi:hypothetical protein